MLTDWALTSAAMWDPCEPSEARNRPHILIRPIIERQFDNAILSGYVCSVAADALAQHGIKPSAYTYVDIYY